MKRIVLLYPGQGSQKVGMGKDFYDNSPLAKEMVQKASDRLDQDMTKLLFEPNDTLNQTQWTQPAILLVSSIATALLKNGVDVNAQYALGHSLGEFSALVAVGALEFANGVELVHKRGEFMTQAARGEDGGMMVVMGLGDEEVEQICTQARNEGKRVWPANYNSDGQIVIAGVKADLKDMESHFKERGAKRAMVLNMSVASHCPLMEKAREPLRDYLERFIQESFQAPVISNVSAKPYKSKSAAVELLDRQLVEPVRYKHSIKNIEKDVDLFIELGEGNVLKGLNRRITKVPTINISDMKSLEEAMETIYK